MKTYKYARVRVQEDYPNTGVGFESTDADLVKRVNEIVKGIFPKCKTSMRNFYEDKPYRLDINKLDTFDVDLGLELIRILCEAGWEPFAGGRMAGTNQGLDVHFKIEVSGTG